MTTEAREIYLTKLDQRLRSITGWLMFLFWFMFVSTIVLRVFFSHRFSNTEYFICVVLMVMCLFQAQILTLFRVVLGGGEEL